MSEGGYYSSGPLSYEIDAHFSNAFGGMNAEFSYDEIGVTEMNVVFMVLHILLIVYALTVRAQLIFLQRNHHTATLLFSIVYLSPFKFIFSCGYWLNYSMKGRSNASMWGIGLIIDAFLTAMMITLFLLLGSGWSVFRRKLPVLNRLRTTFFVVAYVTLAVASAVWITVNESTRVDYASYITSRPGVLLLLLLVGCGIRFNILMQQILNKFSIAPVFYFRLRVLASLYIFAQPVIAVFVVGAPVVYHAKVVTSFWSSVHFIAVFLMVFIYDPRCCAADFPFHAHADEMNDKGTGKEIPTTNSFSGGTLAMIDEDGRVRALNSFDRAHIARLKGKYFRIEKCSDFDFAILRCCPEL